MSKMHPNCDKNTILSVLYRENFEATYPKDELLDNCFSF
jgi:hypothetical protein